MKRLITFLLALSIVSTMSLPVYGAQKKTEVMESSSQAAEQGTSSQTEEQNTSALSGEEAASTESSSSGPAISESSGNESSASNPIGDSSSYYNLSDLGDGPDITAESAILMDASTGAILYSKEADTKRYPASITKVMTALLTIENCSMDDIVTFSNEAVNGIEAGSSSAGINVGAELTVEDTLYAMMLVSANEAAAALAEHVSGSVSAFAELMTKRAQELGCTGTNFTNPHGLPDENHYTTAHDMALILQQAMKYEEFRTIAGTESHTLQASDTLTDTLELWNHAKIMRSGSEYYYEQVEGAKTGYTQAALNTLVTYAKKGKVELICVILKDYGADSSYYDSTALYQWGFEKVKGIRPLNNYDLNADLEKDQSINETKLASIQLLNCTFAKDYYILVNKGFSKSSLDISFTLDEDIHTGRLGYINISLGDTVIGTTPVTYDITTEAAQSYLSGGEADDGLETAPIDTDNLTPHKILAYLVRIIVAFVLIFIIMGIIRRIQAEKRRKQRIKNRQKRRSGQNSKKNTKK